MITNEKKITTKQDKDPYIWDYNIKVKTKDGYDYEEETKEKVKVIKMACKGGRKK